MFGLILHHSDFGFSLDECLDGAILERVHSCAMKVELDHLNDNTFPWLFRGLSVQRVNHVLTVLSRMRQRVYCYLNEEQLKHVFTPYDAMPFKTEVEDDLFVAYSIKDLNDPFRQLLIGPENVSLYERDIPHFGPIYVYRVRVDYTDEEQPEYHMLEIKSSVDDILSVLERLNFGG